MALHWEHITVDCARRGGASPAFWAEALGWGVAPDPERRVRRHRRARRAPRDTPGWLFLQVPEGKTAKNRMHVDLEADDLDAETERLRLARRARAAREARVGRALAHASPTRRATSSASSPDGEPRAGTDPVRDVLPELLAWWRAGRPVGVGTVVATWRSAPRPAGAVMLVGPEGEAVGSVSGGCVEGALYELGTSVRADGVARPAAVRRQRRRRLRRWGSPAAGSSTSSSSGWTGPRSPSSSRWPTTSRRTAGGRLHGDRAPRPGVRRPAPGRASGGSHRAGRRRRRRAGARRPSGRHARVGPARRRRHRRRARPAGHRPHRDAGVRAGRPAPRRGRPGLRRRATPRVLG